MSFLSLSPVAFEAGSILFREGLEAALVVGALASFLAKSGGRRNVMPLLAGVVVAIIASLAAAVLFALFNGGDHNDMIEGITLLVAAGLMLYVSGWLMLRSDPRVWMAKLKAEADAAMSQGNRLAVAALGFLAVFREGAETILFLHALAKAHEGYDAMFLSGLAAGVAVLAVVVAMLYGLALRLPLRPLFAITSAFLFVMGLRFVGAAFQEFQEMGLVAFDPANLPDWLTDLGVSASLEGLSAQALVLVAAIGGTLLAWSRARRTAALPVSAAE
jgi:high-affinity iron transporter